MLKSLFAGMALLHVRVVEYHSMPIDRRTLMKNAAAAALQNSSTAAVGFATGTYGMKSVPTREALSTLARVGYDGVELCLIPGWLTDPARLSSGDRAGLRRMLADSGLALPAFLESLPMIGTPEKRAYNLERLKLAAGLAHALSASRPPCIDTVLGLKSSDWEGAKERMAGELGDWANVAESSSVTIAIKPHAGQALNTPAKALWLLKQTGSARIRLVYDYSHMSLEGFALERSLREMLPETALVSVKDARGTAAHPEYLLPGDGATDYLVYFRLLKRLRYRGFVAVEVSSMIFQKPGYDAIAAAQLCYQRLAPVFEKSGLTRPERN
jgi:sugar phosphate isomerase/epimerase